MTVRIGQIGSGHTHAGSKAAALLRAPEVEFVGVYEPNQGLRAKNEGSEAWTGVTWLDSLDQVLDDPAVGAVFVESQPIENMCWVRQALKAGKHVHCDKPPGASLSELRELTRLARERGLIFQQGYQFRYNRGFAFARQAVQAGLIGRPFHIRAAIPTNLDYYELMRPEVEPFRGGILFVLGSHLVDLVCAILGRPTRATSVFSADGDVPNPYTDNGVGVLEYPRAAAVIETCLLGTDAFAHRRLEVYGTEGSLIVEPFEPPSAMVARREPIDGYASGWQEVKLEDVPRYAEDIEELVGAITRQQRLSFSPEHDLMVHETLLRMCGVAN